MMNKLRSVIFVPLRGYRPRKRPQKYSEAKKSEADGVIGQMTEKDLYFDAEDGEYEPEDFDDMEKFESDFTDAGPTYKQHQHDMYIKKEKLKTQIIARKYFKSEDPNFLTWSEKEEIKSLHKKDSVEWTPERLSEAFPALPGTIRKILRAEWKPLTAKTVVKYDEKVIDNWELFRAKKLPVSPELEAHLEKFKGRKVVAADMKQIAEKFVKQRPVFPDPEAVVFTSLVKDYVESKEEPKDVPQITDGQKTSEFEFNDFKHSSGRKVTFDTFMKETVDKIGDQKNLSVEMELLVEEYKKQKHEKAIEDFATLKSRMEPVIVEKPDDSSKVGLEKEQAVVDHKNKAEPLAAVKLSAEMHEVQIMKKKESLPQEKPQDSKNLAHTDEEKVKITYVDVPKLNIEENSPLTGIIEWKKIQICGTEDYPRFIKIPKDKAKKNITFRVEDRYYDCDGEFLYRVPGLKS